MSTLGLRCGNSPAETSVAAPLPAGVLQHGPDDARQEDAEEGAEAPQPDLPAQLCLHVLLHPCREEPAPLLHESAGP